MRSQSKNLLEYAFLLFDTDNKGYIVCVHDGYHPPSLILLYQGDFLPSAASAFPSGSASSATSSSTSSRPKSSISELRLASCRSVSFPAQIFQFSNSRSSRVCETSMRDLPK